MNIELEIRKKYKLYTTNKLVYPYKLNIVATLIDNQEPLFSRQRTCSYNTHDPSNNLDDDKEILNYYIFRSQNDIIILKQYADFMILEIPTLNSIDEYTKQPMKEKDKYWYCQQKYYFFDTRKDIQKFTIEETNEIENFNCEFVNII